MHQYQREACRPPFGKVREGRIDLAFRRHVQRLICAVG